MPTIKGVRPLTEVKYSKRGRKPSFVILSETPDDDWEQSVRRLSNELQHEIPKYYYKYYQLDRTARIDQYHRNSLRLLAEKEAALGKETFFDFLYSNDLPLSALYGLINSGSIDEVLTEGITLKEGELLTKHFKGWVKSLRKGR